LTPPSRRRRRIIVDAGAYRAGADGHPDRGRPIVLSVQIGLERLLDKQGGYRQLPGPPEALAAPLAHNGMPFGPRRRRKQGAVEAWLREAGCTEWHWLRAGSTIRHADGAREFVRNHKDPPPARYVGITHSTAGLPRA